MATPSPMRVMDFGNALAALPDDYLLTLMQDTQFIMWRGQWVVSHPSLAPMVFDEEKGAWFRLNCLGNTYDIKA